MNKNDYKVNGVYSATLKFFNDVIDNINNLINKLTDSGWKNNVTLNIAGSSIVSCDYRKVGNLVTIQNLRIRIPSKLPIGDIIICTLPVGYRPTVKSCVIMGMKTWDKNTINRGAINLDGTVTYTNADANNTTDYVLTTPVSFYTD